MRVICPTCSQTTTWEENSHRPFCSERCRKIDLGTWAMEGYRIAGEPDSARGLEGDLTDTSQADNGRWTGAGE